MEPIVIAQDIGCTRLNSINVDKDKKIKELEEEIERLKKFIRELIDAGIKSRETNNYK